MVVVLTYPAHVLVVHFVVLLPAVFAFIRLCLILLKVIRAGARFQVQYISSLDPL